MKSNDSTVTSCGPTTLTDEQVDIQVDIANKTTFLGLVGKQSLKATGTGQAHAEQGITKADDSPTIPPIVVNSTPEDPGGPITTAQPPTIDLPCPTWTIGSPTPSWTLSPLPFPRTCTPNVTPTPDPSGTPPTDSPSGPTSSPPSGR